jgi:hypothetical protein
MQPTKTSGTVVSSQITQQDARFIQFRMERVCNHSDRSIHEDAKVEDRWDENAGSCLDLGGAEVFKQSHSGIGEAGRSHCVRTSFRRMRHSEPNFLAGSSFL